MDLLVNKGEDFAYIFLVVRTKLAVGAVAEYLDPAETFVLPCPDGGSGPPSCLWGVISLDENCRFRNLITAHNPVKILSGVGFQLQ